MPNWKQGRSLREGGGGLTGLREQARQYHECSRAGGNPPESSRNGDVSPKLAVVGRPLPRPATPLAAAPNWFDRASRLGLRLAGSYLILHVINQVIFFLAAQTRGIFREAAIDGRAGERATSSQPRRLRPRTTPRPRQAHNERRPVIEAVDARLARGLRVQG